MLRWPGVALLGLAIICAGGTARAEPTAIEEHLYNLEEPLRAPRPRPWPEDLPDPVESESGTLLPPDLAQAVHRRLLDCDSLPGLTDLTLEESGPRYWSQPCQASSSQPLRQPQNPASSARLST